MALVMTKDGQVRPLQPSDLKEVAKRDERIRQLEELNKVLAAEVDRMRPVVEAAVKAVELNGLMPWSLIDAVTTYQASKPK